MQTFHYPMSAFNHIFSDLANAAHLRVSVPESTLAWLSQFSGGPQQHATTGLTPQEKLIHKQDHRRLFFILLRILLPNDALTVIDDAERSETLKWELVDKYEFEDAARCKHQQDSAFSALADFVVGDTTVLPAHLQQLFDLLAAEPAA